MTPPSRATDLDAHVRQLLTRRLGITADALKPESRLLDDLGLDSLDVHELAMTLEEELGATVGEKQLEEVRTVSDLLALVHQLAGQRSQP